MTNFDPFLCRVNEAGVPHFIPINSNITDTVTILWFVPSDMCNFYWLLEKVTFNYSYTITLDQTPESPYVINRNFSALDSSMLPRYRITGAPKFIGSSYDSWWNFSSLASIDLSMVYFNGEAGVYGAKIEFKEWSNPEDDPVLELAFTKRTGESWAYVSYELTFLNTPITVYLNYLTSYILSGTIDSFEITAEFFT
ncbi:MAG: hypothetical protein LBB20_02870 [Puniceicoccales bacterium]|jgi:hypothetical protein|nr:hypothetical protein [Puniceicoccales bacterium]